MRARIQLRHLGLGVVLLSSQIAHADISGKIFRDFNSSGVPDSGESGVADVTIKAYDATGLQSATAISGTDGSYTLGVPAGDYRLEFTWAESWLKPGVAGGTSVQFVANGATDANLALHNPAQTVPSGVTPSIVTAVHSGSIHYGDEFVLTSIPETSGSTSSTSLTSYMTPIPTVLAKENQLGAIWGVAHDRSRQRLLTGAFIKRFTRLAGNATTIYSIPESGGTPSEWVTLDTARIDPHGTAPDWSGDFAVIPSVGKEGLGDVDIAEDGSEVYTIDLKTREFVHIPVGADGSAGTPVRVALPTTLVNCADSNDVRPMGLGVHDGKVYVGTVCSAETSVSDLPIASTDTRKGDPSKLRGYVHVWDGVTDFTLVLDFPLNYERGCLNNGGIGNCSGYGNAAWQAWTPVYPFSSITGNHGYPQPMISDIEFTKNGDMVLGLLDRFGHMDGAYAKEPPSGAFNGGQLTIAGDILHACRTGNTWAMEKLISGDDSCSTAGKGYDADLQQTIDEYYFEDDMGTIAPGNHADVGDGGIGIVLENDSVVSSVMDPARNAPGNDAGNDPWESHGLHWYNSSTGAWDKGYLLVDQGQPDDLPQWGKGNGLGDVEVLYPPAPVEIGNRIWLDSDGDGIQDAGETGIDGVDVVLTCGSGSATVTTVNGGQFLFSNMSGANATFMDYGESCVLSVNDAQPTVSAYSLTKQNVDGTADNNALTDLHDSDAVDNAGVAEISFTVGKPGENNHTLDIGYKVVPVPNAWCPAEAVENFLVNGSFEEGSEGQNAPGWTGSSNISISSSVNPKPDGTQFAFTWDPETFYQDADISSVPDGQAFKLSYYSGSHQPADQSVTIQYLTAIGGSVIGDAKSLLVTHDVDTDAQLAHQELVLGAKPAGANAIRVSVYGGSVDDFIKVDAMCLYSAEVATAVDVSLAKTVEPATAKHGDTVIYTLTVTNAGPDTATGVTVTDKLPAGLTFVSHNGTSSAAYDATTGEWDVGTVEVGEAKAVTLQITATVN